ncbi:MAG: sirohydrochlorin cobaltochelatase [Synergistaceae bacterium]|jgi:sirohydrochlorin cobaltochelatase|nr:sirohydrochlorin cobaltochelatase [Synergistaceae bacterium]
MFKNCFLTAVFVLFFASQAGATESVKRGVLLAAFGTSVTEAERGISNLAEETRLAFPDVEVRLTYTSNIIRRKLKRERGVDFPSPPEALARMNDEGFTHVYVQPMHVIPGEEYDDLKSVVEAFTSIKGKYSFERVALGQPFLSNPSDCGLMSAILARRFADLPSDKAVVLMGHGSPHEANAMYGEMQKALSRLKGRFFLGTVEASPTFEDVLASLKKTPCETVVLSPFMVVAGDHARNDLAGDEPDSWRSRLKKSGYKVEANLVGLGEYPEVAALFVKRVRELME